MKHGPDSDCKGCERVRALAEEVIEKEFNGANCKVCQGWGWVQSCPGCGRVWSRLWPVKNGE